MSEPVKLDAKMLLLIIVLSLAFGGMAAKLASGYLAAPPAPPTQLTLTSVDAQTFTTNGHPLSAHCTFQYQSKVIYGDGQSAPYQAGGRYYGENHFTNCQSNAPDSSWQVIGYDVCFEDSFLCGNDGLMCLYAKPDCTIGSSGNSPAAAPAAPVR